MVGGAAEIDPGGGGAEEGRVRARREGTGKKASYPVAEATPQACTFASL